MGPPPPPEEIAQLMRFVAEKAKNVTSPMNVHDLCRQFKTESGSLLALEGVKKRIRLYRHRIPKMKEFNMDTKIRMMFGLRAPVNPKFLIEMKKVADVEVDDQQRIIHYKQKDGILELGAKKPRKLLNSQGEQRNRVFQFLANKSETIDTPIPDKLFLREFKEKTGCADGIKTLEYRFRRVKETIYQSSEIDKNTKIKMMFISNVKLSEDILEELRQDAVVEVDGGGKITKYKANDGSLELKGSHGISSILKSVHSNRWKTICQKADTDESKEDEKDDSNRQKDYEKMQIDLVRFLIKRTKKATAPLSILKLAKDDDTGFDISAVHNRTHYRIRRFRQRIHEMNQFSMSTKVKMIFALSASIDADFLKELQKCAIVKLDQHRRIIKYEANDRSLKLEGYHRAWVYRRREVPEEPSTSNLEYYYEDNFSDYDPANYEEEMDQILVEKKPSNLLEVKVEVPEGPSTSNFGYHYEEKMEQILIEPKPETA